jgi:uncharacterized protein YukE
VEPLTPADVKRWDADAIHGVFQTASKRADTLQRLGDSLQQVHNGLSDWHGEAGDARNSQNLWIGVSRDLLITS